MSDELDIRIDLPVTGERTWPRQTPTPVQVTIDPDDLIAFDELDVDLCQYGTRMGKVTVPARAMRRFVLRCGDDE